LKNRCPETKELYIRIEKKLYKQKNIRIKPISPKLSFILITENCFRTLISNWFYKF